MGSIRSEPAQCRRFPQYFLLIASSCCALLKIPAATRRLPYKTALGRISLSPVVQSSLSPARFSCVPSGSFLPPSALKAFNVAGYVIQTRPIEFVRRTALVAVCNSAQRPRLLSQNHRAVHRGGEALPGLSPSTQRSGRGSQTGRRRIVFAKGTAAFSSGSSMSTYRTRRLAPQTLGAHSPPIAHGPEAMATRGSANHAARDFPPAAPR
jgi:hypothetical protein